MPTHCVVTPGALAVAGGGLMVVAGLLTPYALCVHEGNCPVFLPMISDTWVHPPGSFISRWVVGVVAMVMGVLQWAVFWADEPGRLSLQCRKALLGITWLACLFFSFVGAVCESSDPDCRGNGGVHGTVATLFFVGYNTMMLVVSCSQPAALPETALAAASVAAKLRFLPSPPGGLLGGGVGDTVVACIEWADVLLVIGWTGGGLRFAILLEWTDAIAVATFFLASLGDAAKELV
eukprot:gene41950-51354_t